MGKMKFKISTVEYGELAKRDKRDKRQNKILIIVGALFLLNFVWDISNRTDQIKETYNQVSNKVEQIYVNLQE